MMAIVFVSFAVGLVSLVFGYLFGRHSAMYTFAKMLHDHVSDSDRVMAEIQKAMEKEERK